MWSFEDEPVTRNCDGYILCCLLIDMCEPTIFTELTLHVQMQQGGNMSQQPLLFTRATLCPCSKHNKHVSQLWLSQYSSADMWFYCWVQVLNGFWCTGMQLYTQCYTFCRSQLWKLQVTKWCTDWLEWLFTPIYLRTVATTEHLFAQARTALSGFQLTTKRYTMWIYQRVGRLSM